MRAYIRGMTHAFRPFAALALALLLVFTAQSMAAARGMPGAAGAVVLCTGTGPVTILTDAEGQPVGPAHICPECTLSLIVAVAQHGVVPVAPLSPARVQWPAGTLLVTVTDLQPFSARDPPAAV